jgi:hypothetical protein
MLDYSSPAEEQRRERAAEEERREAIERYNESTLGEGRPIAWVFVRVVILVGIAVVVAYFLPRWAARLVISLLAVALALWEWRNRGWAPPSWDVLWHPWRR